MSHWGCGEFSEIKNPRPFGFAHVGLCLFEERRDKDTPLTYVHVVHTLIF
jgi:hypothetical protein